MTAKIRRRSAIPVVSLALLAVPALAGPAAAAEPRPPKVDARAWMLVDARDGRALAAKNATRRVSIASTTKLMTAYLSLRRLGLDSRLTAPAYSANPVESRIDLAKGEKMTVRDLLYALMLESANDAAVTLAVGVSGSVPKFVKEMNATARTLELRETRFANPIGLDAAGNRSSARDLAKLTVRLMRDDRFRRIADTPERVLRSGNRTRRIVTRNRLVRRHDWMTGVKTGRTLKAGYVLIGSGRRKGVDLVAVVLGSSSETGRERATLKLLRHGFSLYRTAKPIRAEQVLARVRLRHRDARLPLVAARSVSAPVREADSVTTSIDVPEEVDGPLAKGDRVGTVAVRVEGRRVGTVPLVAGNSVAAATTLDMIRHGSGNPAILLTFGATAITAGAVLGLRHRRRTRRHHLRDQRRREAS